MCSNLILCVLNLVHVACPLWAILQTSFFLFHPRSRERNDEYKFDEEYFPAKVSLLLRGSKGLGEDGGICPYTFVPKCLRISLVRAIYKLSLFINENLTLATNYHTIQIQRTRRNKVFLVKYHFNVITNSLVWCCKILRAFLVL